MGSTSDWETMKNASDILTDFDVPHETKVVSAHRTPDLLFEFAKSAESRGIEVIIAGAGSNVSRSQIISLLQRFEEAALDIIKTENLYNFNGTKGYSA